MNTRGQIWCNIKTSAAFGVIKKLDFLRCDIKLSFLRCDMKVNKNARVGHIT